MLDVDVTGSIYCQYGNVGFTASRVLPSLFVFGKRFKRATEPAATASSAARWNLTDSPLRAVMEGCGSH